MVDIIEIDSNSSTSTCNNTDDHDTDSNNRSGINNHTAGTATTNAATKRHCSVSSSPRISKLSTSTTSMCTTSTTNRNTNNTNNITNKNNNTTTTSPTPASASSSLVSPSAFSSSRKVVMNPYKRKQLPTPPPQPPMSSRYQQHQSSTYKNDNDDNDQSFFHKNEFCDDDDNNDDDNCGHSISHHSHQSSSSSSSSSSSNSVFAQKAIPFDSTLLLHQLGQHDDNDTDDDDNNDDDDDNEDNDDDDCSSSSEDDDGDCSSSSEEGKDESFLTHEQKDDNDNDNDNTICISNTNNHDFGNRENKKEGNDKEGTHTLQSPYPAPTLPPSKEHLHSHNHLHRDKNHNNNDTSKNNDDDNEQLQSPYVSPTLPNVNYFSTNQNHQHQEEEMVPSLLLKHHDMIDLTSNDNDGSSDEEDTTTKNHYIMRKASNVSKKLSFFDDDDAAAIQTVNHDNSHKSTIQFDSTISTTATKEEDRIDKLHSHPTITNNTNKTKKQQQSAPNEDQILHSTSQIPPPAQQLQPREQKPFKRIAPKINPSLYKPPSPSKELLYNKADPILHELSIHNRPLSNRRMIPVTSLFRKPISNFWNAKWHSFNHIQSELSQSLVHSDDNVVVSAPTGAGKTCVFEMAMARLFQTEYDSNRQRNNDNNHTKTSTSYIDNNKLPNFRKIVYLSPSKALCQERYADWSKRLAEIDSSIECAMVTGDSSEYYAAIQEVASAHVILTTPEKWDSITRKWTDHLFLIGSVKLLLIDEVHLLGDDSRGSCLETIICRMKTVQRAAKAQQDCSNNGSSSMDDKTSGYLSRSANTTTEALSSNMRIVAVSATLPNIVDIASFLDAHEAYLFDSSFRPVPLTTHVIGLGQAGKNQFLFDKNLNRHVPDLVKRFSDGRPTIIFCHTKKTTEALASELTSSIGRGGDSNLSKMASQTNHTSLKHCLLKGIAFHHAGLEHENRKLVENSFSKGLIKCLCATSTLAMGVNLPARLVVIKGTSVWRGAGQGYQDIDSGMLLQMMGRAGRPGLDDCGTSVIMTDTSSKYRYERMTHGLRPVESMLPKQLTETLNSEISQKVITNTKEAIDWLKGTFFFIRVKKNAKYYGLQGRDNNELESYLMSQCVVSLQKLHEANIIDLDTEGNNIVARPASHVMSRQIISFDGMKAIVELPHDSGPLQILNAISSMEGTHFPVRRNEKSLLNNAHKLIRFKLEGTPSKIRIQKSDQKAFVLLQAGIGQHFLDDFTLRQEMSLSIEFASRVLSAAEEYSVEDSKHGQVALESLILRRCLATSLWGPGNGVLNQLRGVGAKTAAKLAMNSIRSFDDVLIKSSNEIENACGRKSPFGQDLKRVISQIKSKSLSLDARVEGLLDSNSPNELICNLTSDDMSHTGNNINGSDSRIVTYTLAVHTDRPGGSLMFRTDLNGPSLHRIQCPDKFGRVYVRLVSNLVGLDQQQIIEGNDVVKKSAFLLSPKNTKQARQKRQNSSKVQQQQHSKNPSTKVQNLVDGVDDFRVIRKNRKESNEPKVTTPPPTKPVSLSKRQVSPPCVQTVITPSPSVPTVVAGSPNFQCTPHTSVDVSTNIEGFNRERTIVRDPKRSRIHQGSWIVQKQKQQKFQRRAFGSPKENPFAKFRFDPNSVEKQLEMESENHTDRPNVTSVIPPSVDSSKHRNDISHAERRYRKTPSRNLNVKFTGSARRGIVGNPHQFRQADVLRQKAAEQQAYANTNHQYFNRGGIHISGNKSQHPQHPNNQYRSQPMSSVPFLGGHVNQHDSFGQTVVNYQQREDVSAFNSQTPGMHMNNDYNHGYSEMNFHQYPEHETIQFRNSLSQPGYVPVPKDFNFSTNDNDAIYFDAQLPQQNPMVPTNNLFASRAQINNYAIPNNNYAAPTNDYAVLTTSMQNENPFKEALHYYNNDQYHDEALNCHHNNITDAPFYHHGGNVDQFAQDSMAGMVIRVSHEDSNYMPTESNNTTTTTTNTTTTNNNNTNGDDTFESAFF